MKKGNLSSYDEVYEKIVQLKRKPAVNGDVELYAEIMLLKMQCLRYQFPKNSACHGIYALTQPKIRFVDMLENVGAEL